jgi:uncharacterized membrane protein
MGLWATWIRKKFFSLVGGLALAKDFFGLLPLWWQTIILWFANALITVCVASILWLKNIVFGSLPLQIVIAMLFAAIVPALFAWRKYHRAAQAFIERQNIALQAYDDQQMKDWLAFGLKPDRLGIVGVACFGSVIHNYPTANDVDVIIVLKDEAKSLIRMRVKYIKQIGKEFQCVFTHSLHIQWFLESEHDRMHQFLIRAGSHESLFGDFE